MGFKREKKGHKSDRQFIYQEVLFIFIDVMYLQFVHTKSAPGNIVHKQMDNQLFYINRSNLTQVGQTEYH